MGVAFGGFLALMGIIGVASTVFSIQRALTFSEKTTREYKIAALIKAIVSGASIAAGVTLIGSSLNDDAGQLRRAETL